MKNFRKGQSFVQFLLMTVLVLGIVLGSIYLLGENLSGVFRSNNPVKTFNAKRTMKNENMDLVSNINLNVSGVAVTAPIEKTIKANILNGSYVQTSGSSGRSKEVAQILQEYTTQIGTIASGLSTGTTNYTNFNTALNTYKAVLSNAITQLNAAGTDELKIKLALLDMAIKLNNSGTIATNLRNTGTVYIGSLANSKKKQLLSLYLADLYNFAASMQYSINPSLYTTLLGTSQKNTLTQDQSLVTLMNSQVNSYSATVKENYAKKINIDLTNTYSGIAPSSFNNSVLCKTLGGTLSGTSCTVK